MARGLTHDRVEFPELVYMQALEPLALVGQWILLSLKAFWQATVKHQTL